MPNVCCAVGCQSNYKSTLATQGKVPVHGFLSNPDHFQEWFRRIRRDDETFTEEKAKKAKLCTKHFTEDDYIMTSTDSNATRKSRKDGNLKLR